MLEIAIVVGIIGILAAMAVVAFTKIRERSQRTSVKNNLRALASAADQYFAVEGYTSVTPDQLIGGSKYIKNLQSIAGENYATDMPAIELGMEQLTINVNGLGAVSYPE